MLDVVIGNETVTFWLQADQSGEPRDQRVRSLLVFEPGGRLRGRHHRRRLAVAPDQRVSWANRARVSALRDSR